MTNPLGDQLFRDVVSYASLPSHRTGTPQDAQTVEWLDALLRSDGALTERQQWEFPQWSANWSAELDGSAIDCLPIFYSGVGTFGPPNITITPTAHSHGLFSVKNVRPSNVAVGSRPTMQVAGCYAGREQEIRAHITEAKIMQGSSSNILATYGCSLDTAEVLIGTPTSGWFSCASERGTGIAVARWLARTLAAEGKRVALLATSGHELFNIGLQRFLETWPSTQVPRCTPKAIVHIGASVGARNYAPVDLVRTPAFSDTLFAITNQVDSPPTAALAALGFHPRIGTTDPKMWVGEGTNWCALDLPLLSIAGMSHWFHSPDDTADNATHPTLLAAVATALHREAQRLMNP
jgi:hypothetical protein